MTAPRPVGPEEVLAAVARLDTAAAHEADTPWADLRVVLEYARQAGRHPPPDAAPSVDRMGDLVPVPRGRLARWAQQVSTLAQHAIRSPNATEAAHEMATDIARWACRRVEPADTPPPGVPR